MLLRKIKSRLYMKNVSLPKHADDLRTSEGTAVSAQEATLFKMKPSDGWQSGLGWCKTYEESSVMNVLFFPKLLSQVTPPHPTLWRMSCPQHYQ